MTNERRWRAAWLWGTLLVAAGLAGSAAVLAPRLAMDAAPPGPVELTMDWQALESTATEWHQDPAAVLKELARAGLTSVAVTEQTVGGLVAEGRALAVSPEQVALLRAYVPALGRLGEVSPGAGTWLLVPGQEPRLVPAPMPQALDFGVGMPQQALAAAREAGLPVLLRYGDRQRLGPVATAADAGGLPTSRVVIFEGPKVPDPETVAEPLRSGGYALGLVEFASQRGAGDLARRLGLAAVPVHSMKAEEIAASGAAASAARYIRAVKERGVRVLYLRPAPSEEETRRLVELIKSGLSREGFTTGLAQPERVIPGPSAPFLLLMGLGAGGLAAWAWAAWAGRTGAGRGLFGPAGITTAFALAGAIGGAAMAWARLAGWDSALSVLLRQLGALAVALVAPVAASGAARSVTGRLASGATARPGQPQEPRAEQVAPGRWAGPGRAWAAAAAGLAVFAAISAAAGLLVAGMLGDSLFVLRIEQFKGVKLAHALPPLLVGAAALWACGVSWRRIGEWLARPVRWVDAAAAGALLVAGLYYLIRTGNEAAAVPEVERAVRGFLEDALAVRPRTKEFLVGYPALAAALYLWARGRAGSLPAAFAGLVAAGAIASVSVVNSFAHIHTPLPVTAQRELNGFLLGLVLACLVWAVQDAWLARKAQGPEGTRSEGASHPEGRGVGVLRVR